MDQCHHLHSEYSFKCQITCISDNFQPHKTYRKGPVCLKYLHSRRPVCVPDEEMEGPSDGDDGSTEQDSNDEEDAVVEDIDKDIDKGCSVFEVNSCMSFACGCASAVVVQLTARRCSTIGFCSIPS